MCEPLFIDHLGEIAEKVVREGDSTRIKFATSVGSNGGPEWDQTVTAHSNRDRWEVVGHHWKRILPVTSTAPEAGTSGEVWLSTDTSGPGFYRIGKVDDVDGYYDASPIVGTASVSVEPDPTKMTLSSLLGLWIDRVVRIEGAGLGGSNLVTRIVDLRMDAHGIRTAWITPPAKKSVTNGKILPIAPHVEVLSATAMTR
jgi:hypothetical protein